MKKARGMDENYIDSKLINKKTMNIALILIVSLLVGFAFYLFCIGLVDEIFRDFEVEN